MAHAKDADDQDGPPSIRITVVIANRYALDIDVATGEQIRQRTNIPAGFALYRRMRGGNEPIGDDDSVQLRDGDHFFARPPSNL
jgi:hypothetical protein